MHKRKLRWADREVVAVPKRLQHSTSQAPIQRNRPSPRKVTDTNTISDWIGSPLTTRLRNKA